jgi:2-polyprenyl-3-methyl-5-hydroxy-6-metoxy-1,4-benzoquinol methylase
VQFHAAGFHITEVPIPTYYGDEICHVNGMQYAWQCVRTSMKYRLMQFEIFYDPKFDIRRRVSKVYTAKRATTSLHHFIRHIPLEPGSRLIDVGGGDGEAVGRAIADRGIEVTCIDQGADMTDSQIRQFHVDLDEPWERQFEVEAYDTTIALDVIEHLKSPERGLAEIFRCLKSGGKLYASTGNVAFLPVRLAMLLGWFNYGRRGILDLTHKRLFTVDSFRRSLKNAGFRIDRIIGFGPPLADLTGGRSKISEVADRLLSRLARTWPKVFAYQILIECTRTDSPADLMRHTFLPPLDQARLSQSTKSESSLQQ